MVGDALPVRAPGLNQHHGAYFPRWVGPVFNLGLFVFGWFACVMGAAQGWPLLGTVIGCLMVAIHLVRSVRPLVEIRLLACATLLGLAVDTALRATGAVRYHDGFFPGAAGAVLAPHWIVASWMLLASVLNVTLRWLKGRWSASAAIGAAMAPLACWTGERLGATALPLPPLALLLTSATWALMLPLMVRLGMRFDGGGER